MKTSNFTGPVYALEPDFSSCKSTTGPCLLLAGDGTQSVYVFTPIQGGWDYTKTELANVGGTVMTLAAFDVDGDGHLELVIPNQDDGSIRVFSFSP